MESVKIFSTGKTYFLPVSRSRALIETRSIQIVTPQAGLQKTNLSDFKEEVAFTNKKLLACDSIIDKAKTRSDELLEETKEIAARFETLSILSKY